MEIVVFASDVQWNELTNSRPDVKWIRTDNSEGFVQYTDAAAFFCLKDNTILSEFASFDKPVFINSVIHPLKELNALGNVLRINGWQTFLNRSSWEISGAVDEKTRSVFKALDINVNIVADEPGFIAARVIAMIINEAYFAVEDNVSSKTEIDTAMKLGTNYPHGPFEWAALIGIKNIFALLQKLNATDTRYRPSEMLMKEAK